MQTSQNWQSELAQALALLEQGRPDDCAARLRTLLRRCDNDPQCRALTLDGLGRALLAAGHAAQAAAALEESLALLRSAAGPSSPLTLGAMQNLAHVWLEQGETQKSAALGREAVQGCEAAFGPDSPRLAGALLHLAAAHYRQKDFDAAETCLQRARAIWEAQRPVPPELGVCLNNLGRIQEERGRRAEGIALHRQAVALRRDLLGDCHGDTAFSLGNLGVALASDGQWPEAADTLEAALACYARLGKYDCPDALGYKDNLALCRRVLAADGAGAETAAGPSAPFAPQSREALLQDIIRRELVMFLATPNEGGVAACQQQPDSFRLMRRMAHEALSDATLASWQEDLLRAEREGRNVMIEKYARMDNLLPPLCESPRIDEIVDAEATFMREAATRYPRVIRPAGQGLFRNYLRCELETFSPATLELYAEDMRRARREGRNPVVARYERLARLLGKSSLEDMEKEMR